MLSLWWKSKIISIRMDCHHHGRSGKEWSFQCGKRRQCGCNSVQPNHVEYECVNVVSVVRSICTFKCGLCVNCICTYWLCTLQAPSRLEWVWSMLWPEKSGSQGHWEPRQRIKTTALCPNSCMYSVYLIVALLYDSSETATYCWKMAWWYQCGEWLHPTICGDAFGQSVYRGSLAMNYPEIR